MPSHTKHFTLIEFLRSNTARRRAIDNTPTAAELAEIINTMSLAETVRSICGNRSMKITSGFRCYLLNKAVGGASKSDHMSGRAMDFKIIGQSIETSFQLLIAALPKDSYRVIIQEKHRWIHISLPDGTRPNGNQLRYHGRGKYTLA